MDLELAYSAWLAGEEATRQSNISLARDYYAGDHDVPLTERQKEYLGFNEDESRFALNYCATVVDAVVDRLIVSTFSSENDTLAGDTWDWWQQNRMDEKQRNVHKNAVRDGEAFVIVDWDDEQERPRFSPHPRYVDAAQGGDGYGCKAHYPDDDPSQSMLYASKRWTEKVDGREQQKMNVYHPDRVEKYELKSDGDESDWRLIDTVPWVTGMTVNEEGELEIAGDGGEPLGIPVIHFRNPSRQTELWDAIPIQDAVNKTALDILAAADTAGFPIFVAKGFTPTTDGKAPDSDGDNYIQLFPGAMVEVHQDGDLDRVGMADLSPMLATLDNLVLKLAQITDTPTSRFQVTKQIAAEGTLKQQEEPLLSKVRVRQTLFGNSWEDVLYMARVLYNEFGDGDLPADELVEAQWEPAETRDGKAKAEELGLKVEKLGIPLEQAWREAGYSQEEIDQMKAMRGEELAQQSNIGGELLRAFEGGGF
jgi:hypothetical protein